MSILKIFLMRMDSGMKDCPVVGVKVESNSWISTMFVPFCVECGDDTPTGSLSDAMKAVRDHTDWHRDQNYAEWCESIRPESVLFPVYGVRAR